MKRRAFLAGAGGLTLAAVGCAPAARIAVRPAEPPAARIALPARLTIPSLGIDARVAPVGVNAEGAMDVPGTADEVAWYELGPRPGERGNAVLAGHNVWNGRPGAFVNLRRLRVNDRVDVVTSMQASFSYRVDGIASYPADKAPLAEVFGASAEPRLTLITCAGRPDTRGAYPDRLVVTARRLD